MTREEAIQVLNMVEAHGLADEAKRMAIEALHREEAEEKGWCHRIRPKNVEVVVRCKDCKWHKLTDNNGTEVCTNKQWDISMAVYPIISADDFCSYGERREP